MVKIKYYICSNKGPYRNLIFKRDNITYSSEWKYWYEPDNLWLYPTLPSFKYEKYLKEATAKELKEIFIKFL